MDDLELKRLAMDCALLQHKLIRTKHNENDIDLFNEINDIYNILVRNVGIATTEKLITEASNIICLIN